MITGFTTVTQTPLKRQSLLENATGKNTNPV